MENTRSPAVNLCIFAVLLTFFSAIGFWLIFRLERASPYMLSVGMAAIAVCLITKRPITTLGWSWGDWKIQWLNYLLPLGITLVSYLVIWNAGFGDWYNLSFVTELKDDYNLDNWNSVSIVAFHFLVAASFSFILSLPSVVGEEIGWRGFLTPELSK